MDAEPARWPSLSRLAGVFLAGTLSVQYLPTLPSVGLSTALLVAASAGSMFPRRASWRLAAAFVVAACWAAIHGAVGMERRLPVALEGVDVMVEGRIVDLPAMRGTDASFVLRPDKAWLGDETIDLDGDIRLSWFRAPVVPGACERWRLALRLRRPRGMVNPGGSDAERVALQRGIVAMGYVRDGPRNGVLGYVGVCAACWREHIAGGIEQLVGMDDARLLKALAVGDVRGLTLDDWDIARANGVSHLIAISGFHVGVAAVAGTGFVAALYALFPALALRSARRPVQASAGLAVAGAYSVLAGLGLPTVRTLLMIAVVVLATCARRQAGGASALALALLAVLVVDPLSVLSAGFWLSFSGVGLLMLCLPRAGRGVRAWLTELLRAQLLMTVALLPISLWFFGTASLVGLLSNLVAAPLVSFVVVPLTLAGCLCMAIAAPLAGPLLALAAGAMNAQWWMLEHMATWPGTRISVPGSGVWRVMLATAGAAWLFAPRGLPLRAFGAFAFLPLALPGRDVPESGAFRAWVLDVGQGLAVVVRTAGHTLVYDTGASFASGFDLGMGVVLPSLDALGTRDIDALVVSHGDSDHAGGASSVASRYPDAVRYLGEPSRGAVTGAACEAGHAWEWDGVRFRFIHPGPGDDPGKGNDRSCVLSIEGHSGRLLLTGDIGASVERSLRDVLADERPTVLTVPHHGSRYSSTAGFVDTVSPVIAIASAGWRNRFGHPHASVVARYRDAGSAFHSTAVDGAIELTFPRDAAPDIARRWRQSSRRYWRE
ncbi:competence protein ComEC [Luteibacter rhizovicinus]|uniref:Competence protein ComEC n=1 Tax=Luteibacter rhizovicinus TaxID=242606 RepID=A0A4R3YY93_9GAMM|nr:DNA internalization-related competence protein ComEC/Rec2 [Luteibacter rhizovicinus]TCV97566.1 competence protein ComEC [Luteibacter rhizovicinus]